MKFASLRHSIQHENTPVHSKRDGLPVLIFQKSESETFATRIDDIGSSLREIIERWDEFRPRLLERDLALKAGRGVFFKTKVVDFLAPLPRAFQWVDGSAFLHHVKLVRQARKAAIPESLYITPLMYQGGSDTFLAPTDAIPFQDAAYGLDFESEVVVITNDVEMGISPALAIEKIVLIMIANDVSLRGLIPEELAQGFGFLQSKPSTAFAPYAITPDELGPAWTEGRVHLPLITHFNDQEFGRPNAAAMHFNFGQLIAHAARTRHLSAGTIVGSGTVSNEDPAVGSSCLAEKRTLEVIQHGTAVTPFMKPGDHVQIEMFNAEGKSLFGRIHQVVSSAQVKS